MKTSLNNFFWKKSDFEFDAGLKALNELWYHVFTEQRKLLKVVLPRNIIYFAKHKKLFITKLLAFGTAIVISTGIIISIILFILNYVGIIDIDVSKAKPKVENVLTVYLPDTDTLAQIECIKRKIKYITIFLPDNKKNWKAFKKRFQQIEAHGLSDAGSYYAKSKDNKYWGKYQLGEQAREIGNIKDITFKDFSSNPDLQEGCFLAWIRFLKDRMQPEINRYVGANMNGIQITESGIIALAHNVGDGACREFLRNNGSTIPATSFRMAFLRIGGYDLSKIE